MGALDFLEEVGGKAGSFVSMITDWKVILVLFALAFLVFVVVLLAPAVIWVMRSLH
jgi:hypothetical protein